MLQKVQSSKCKFDIGDENTGIWENCYRFLILFPQEMLVCENMEILCWTPITPIHLQFLTPPSGVCVKR